MQSSKKLPHMNGVELRGGATMASVIKTLKRRLESFETAAVSIRTTLAVLEADVHHAVVKRAPTIMADALELDRERIERRGRPRKKKKAKKAARVFHGAPPPKPRFPHTEKLKRQRTATSRVLSQFDMVTPKRIPFRGLGALVRRGYLIKADNGYLRTDKPFSIQMTKAEA